MVTKANKTDKRKVKGIARTFKQRRKSYKRKAGK